ncbi:MAG: C4-type zinc ribbon domain-containing protein [Planctomycetota bacterium]
MNNQIIEKLKELQAIDARIGSLNKSCVDKSSGLDCLKENIQRLQKQMEEIKQKVKQLRIEVDKKDLELKSNEEKISKLNTQLNTVRTNKEYSALTNEIKSAKADNEVIEDVILNLFNQNELIQKEAKEVEAKIKEETNQLNAMSAQVGEEIAHLKTEIESVCQLRQKNTAQIDAEVLSKYEKIISNKSDRAALACVGEPSKGYYTCQGCHMDVPAQQVNELMKKKEMVCCKSCLRILYIESSNANNAI